MQLDLDQKELEQVLKEIVEKLIKKGILPSGVNKDKLVKDVAATLMATKDKEGLDLNNLNLRDEKIMKGLEVACIAQLNPNNKFNYTILFKPQANIKEEDLKLQLQNVFTALLLLKFQAKELSPKELQAMQKQVSALVDKLFDKFQLHKSNENNLVCENNALRELVGGCIDELNRQFYGAGKPGEVPQPRSFLIGDLIGAADYEASYTGGSFMAQLDNPNMADPLGMKVDELINEIVSGATIDNAFELTILDDIENIFQDNHVLDNKTPKLTQKNPYGG